MIRWSSPSRFCPVQPVIADGRLFLRTANGLACYDLRRQP